jgi:ribosomal protein S12 methylthiotransferase accessory factor
MKRLTDVCEYLVDRRLGVIKYVQELPHFPGTPDFYHFFAMACNTHALNGIKNFNNAGGASIYREIALAKAIGEAVERYCSAIYDINDFPLGSYDSVEFPCVDPADFALHSSKQYEQENFMYVPFNKSTSIRWTEAFDPLLDERIYVPASMVYMPYYYYQNSNDSPICQPMSTGMSCHCSLAEAALGGAYEVIERDALTITWQAMLSMPQIRVKSLSDVNYERVKRFENVGSTVTLLDMTLDVGIPSILSVLQSFEEEMPTLVFAAASEINPEEAICKSLEELAHTRRYSNAIKSWVPRIVPNPPTHDNIVDQVSHLNFWTDGKNSHLADFIFKSEKRIDFQDIPNQDTGDPKKNLEIVCKKLRSTGHRLLLVDMTTPDIRDLGLSVMRALIPGYHSLFMSYHSRCLGGKRLWEIPAKLGHEGITYEMGDNPSPHMFP